MLLGFAGATQVREAGKADFSGLREEELVAVLEQLDAQENQLGAENLALERELAQLQDQATRGQAALDAAAARAETQGVLAGTLAAQGPGVTVTISDPERKMTAVGAYLLVDELRNAGAEAITLGPVRITASSYFESTVRNGQPVLLADGVEVEPPYEWRAIGEPSTLETALGIPGGALAAVRTQGGTASVTKQDHLEITSTKVLGPTDYASAIE
jgi:uncharacterized protein YlxW (UPF0749 family)